MSFQLRKSYTKGKKAKTPFHHKPEANFQGEFYHWARVIGLNCCLEYHTKIGRLDIAAFNSDWTKLIAIVECKRADGRFDMDQIERYKKIGVPVYGLKDAERAEGLARQILRKHSGEGVGIARVQSVEREDKMPPVRPMHRVMRDGAGRKFKPEEH